MSNAPRDTNSFRCSVFWNGQANSPEQRKRTPSSPAELISRTTGVCSGHGHFLGNSYSFVPFGRFSATMPSTCGITSPARWIVTVSPMRTSSRAISSALCKRRVLHDHAADADRLELCDRRQRAGAADLDLDVAHHRRRLLGGEFVRDRPAGTSRDEAQPLLPVEPVDLVDDAVDVVVELAARETDLVMHLEQVLGGFAQLEDRIGVEAALAEPLHHAGLRVGRHLAHLPPRIGEEAQRPRRRDAGVLLPQRAGRGVARIDVKLLAGGLLPLVQREEIRLGHVDLAAHLGDVRNVLALQRLRHVLQRLDVRRDVLADRAVAARRRMDQLALLVAQRHRQPVDLRLGRERERLVGIELEKAADALDEACHVLFGERIVEREHRHRVPHLGETPGRRRTDLQREAFQRAQIGKALLDRAIALAQRVVFGVRDGRLVVLVIALVVRGEFAMQPRMLGLGLLFGESDGFGRLAIRHGRLAGHPPCRTTFWHADAAQPRAHRLTRLLDQPLGRLARLLGDLRAGQHAGDLLAAAVGGELR